MTAYQGVPDIFRVTCPICFEIVELPVGSVSVDRVVNNIDVVTHGGGGFSIPGERGLVLEIRGHTPHNCPEDK